eukprot:CAMPEP_0114509118 /NCGR_PEP_ID=MMETSP0109-20121206/13021_1 /TAXON_ID=29199 /ORGANISM="Chlorarachnion reptans, Strain CCCM449" /LENGTH=228 /DNA_ID=CAMNT_0001688213 /DNA_START=346 /DNA_END=1028 /DNA_ORIENTATION=+
MRARAIVGPRGRAGVLDALLCLEADDRCKQRGMHHRKRDVAERVEDHMEVSGRHSSSGDRDATDEERPLVARSGCHWILLLQFVVGDHNGAYKEACELVGLRAEADFQLLETLVLLVPPPPDPSEGNSVPPFAEFVFLLRVCDRVRLPQCGTADRLFVPLNTLHLLPFVFDLLRRVEAVVREHVKSSVAEAPGCSAHSLQAPRSQSGCSPPPPPWRPSTDESPSPARL